MGKGQKDRVKGNLQPASSARAVAALQASSNSNAAGAVVGAAVLNPFAAVAAASSPSSSSQQDYESYEAISQLDSDLVLLLRKLAKRDPTTKLRALEELEAYIKKTDDAEALTAFAPVWPKLYNRVGSDVDRRVRQTAHSVHRLVAVRLGRRLAPILREVIGTWVTGMFDTNREVAKAARDGFYAAFPEAKQKEALLFCQEELLQYTRECIFEKTSEMLSDPRFTTKEDMEAKYARVVSSCIHVISHLIESLSRSELEGCHKEYALLLDDPRIWSKISDKLPAIRRSSYTLIITLATKWDDLLDARLDKVAPIILCKCFNETEAANHPDMWAAVITFTKALPNSWAIANLEKKPATNKVLNFLRKYAATSATSTYPSLIALLASLPEKMFENNAKLCHDFLSSLWLGAADVDRGGATFLLNAYFECLLFFIKTTGESASEELKAEQKGLFMTHLWLFVVSYIYSAKPTELQQKVPVNAVCSIVATYIAKISAVPTSKENFKIFWELLSETLVSTIQSGLPELPPSDNAAEKGGPTPALPDSFEAICTRICDLLVAISSAASVKSKGEVTSAMLVESLVGQLLKVTLKKCSENTDPPIGDCMLASQLTKRFSAYVFGNMFVVKAIMLFVRERLPSLLGTCSSASVPYLLDLFAARMRTANESEVDVLRKSWEAIVQGTVNVPEEERRVSLSSALVSKVYDSKVLMPFSNPMMDNYVLSLVDNHLGNDEDGSSEEREHKIEELVATSLISEGNRLLSAPALAKVLARFDQVLQEMTQNHFFTNRSESGLQISRALAVLRVLSRGLRPAFVSSLLASPSGPSIIANVFDLGFVRHQQGTRTEIQETQLKHVKDEAVACWDAVTSCWGEGKGQTAVVLRRGVREIVCKRVQESFKNIKHGGSPSDFVQQVTKIIRTTTSVPDEVQTTFASFLFDREYWRQTASPLFYPINASLGIVDPLVASLSMIAIGDETANEAPVPEQHDIYGLSAYGRLVLFTSELTKKVGAKQIFTPERRWLLLELLSARQVCMDALTLMPAGISGSKLWDSTVHVAENQDIFQTFADDVHQATQVIIQAELDSNKGSLEGIHSQLVDAVMQKTTEESGLVLRLIADVSADAAACVEGRTCWVRVLRTLLGWIVEHRKLSLQDAEIWASLLDADCRKLDLPRSLAVIHAMGAPSPLSSAYRPFLNDVAGKLSGADANQLAETSGNNASMTYLVLFKAMAYETASSDFLTQQRAVFLLQTIGKWYEVSVFAMQVENALADVLRCLALVVADMAGAHWELMLTRCSRWLETANEDEPCGLLLANSALKLLAELVETATTNDDLDSLIRASRKGIFTVVLDLLLKQSVHIARRPSKPKSEYLEQIAYLVDSVPPQVLNERKPISELCSLLQSLHEPTQKCAFKLLQRIIKERTQSLSIAIEMQDNTVEDLSLPLPEPITRLLLEPPKADLWELAHISDEEHHATLLHFIFGYLLAWMATLDHFEDATFELKANYVAHVRKIEAIDKLLPYIFSVLGVTGEHSPFDVSKWEINEYDVEGFDSTSESSFPLLAAHLYYRILKHMPSLARTWWTECKMRQTTLAVDNYTEKYISPLLIGDEIQAVQQAPTSAPEGERDVAVRASRVTNEVTASCLIDEQNLSFVIRLPSNYPLRQVEVEGTQRAGVTEARWRGWLLGAQAIITSQNGTILDALTLFRRNVSLHFQGVEDCTICYSIISSLDRTLPTKTCRTCKHRFHGACLFKWFRTSNSSACPLCRGEW